MSVVIFEYVSGAYLAPIRDNYRPPIRREKAIHFDAFYTSKKNGLMVYGQVVSASDGGFHVSPA